MMGHLRRPSPVRMDIGSHPWREISYARLIDAFPGQSSGPAWAPKSVLALISRSVVPFFSGQKLLCVSRMAYRALVMAFDRLLLGI